MTRTELAADCTRCCALCCVAPAFPASDDFAFAKPAHAMCPHLLADHPTHPHHCGIHSRLVERGFRGCAVYDCAGAGQKVTQATFGGRAWRELDDPRPMFEAFMVMRVLHQQLALLDTARRRLQLPADLDAELAGMFARVEAMTFLDAAPLCSVDVTSIERECSDLLREIGARHRSAAKVLGRPAQPME